MARTKRKNVAATAVAPADDEAQQQQAVEEEEDRSCDGEKRDLEVEIVEQKIVFLIPTLPPPPRKKQKRKKEAGGTNSKRTRSPQEEQRQQQHRNKAAEEVLKCSLKLRRHCYTNGTLVLNTQFLRKKLERSGGLSVWLTSKGLARFAPVFQRNKIGEGELLHLTMDALKQAGVSPVGPRRKLLSAIRQLCLISF